MSQQSNTTIDLGCLASSPLAKLMPMTLKAMIDAAYLRVFELEMQKDQMKTGTAATNVMANTIGTLTSQKADEILTQAIQSMGGAILSALLLGGTYLGGVKQHNKNINEANTKIADLNKLSNNIQAIQPASVQVTTGQNSPPRSTAQANKNIINDLKKPNGYKTYVDPNDKSKLNQAATDALSCYPHKKGVVIDQIKKEVEAQEKLVTDAQYKINQNLSTYFPMFNSWLQNTTDGISKMVQSMIEQNMVAAEQVKEFGGWVTKLVDLIFQLCTSAENDEATRVKGLQELMDSINRSLGPVR